MAYDCSHTCLCTYLKSDKDVALKAKKMEHFSRVWSPYLGFWYKRLEVDVSLDCNYAIYICIAKDLNLCPCIFGFVYFFERGSHLIS